MGVAPRYTLLTMLLLLTLLTLFTLLTLLTWFTIYNLKFRAILDTSHKVVVFQTPKFQLNSGIPHLKSYNSQLKQDIMKSLSWIYFGEQGLSCTHNLIGGATPPSKMVISVFCASLNSSFRD